MANISDILKRDPHLGRLISAGQSFNRGVNPITSRIPGPVDDYFMKIGALPGALDKRFEIGTGTNRGPIGAPGQQQPNAIQRVLQQLQQQKAQQPNHFQQVANDLNPNVFQRVGRAVNPQVNSAINTALNRQPIPQPEQPLPAFNEFARRAQNARAKGMTPADQRFSNLSDQQLDVLANPAGPDAAPQLSESGQRLKLETGRVFDDGWLDEIDNEYAIAAWNDPLTAARVVLQANGITEDSRFGQDWMENLAYLLPDLYRQQAASEPGSVAADGSDFLAFSQGYLETLLSPVGSEDARATLQSMNDFGIQQLNAIFNDPESDIAVRVQTAIEESAQYGDEAETLYQMAIAPAIRNYAGTDKQIIQAQLGKHYEQFQVRHATGYPGGFLAYLRDETNFLDQIT